MLQEIRFAANDAAAALSDGHVRSLGIAVPPRLALGDIAISLSTLTKTLKRSPESVGGEVVSRIATLPNVASVAVVGGHVNVHLETASLFDAAIRANGGKNSHTVANPETIMVEYLSPNTNKPLHLGHVRNGVIGSTIARLLDAVGHSVIRAELVNDRGEHICKSMLAYQLFGDNETPKSRNMKGDHFVGEMYVRYANEEKRDESISLLINKMLKAWEDGDPDVRALWRTMNSWVYEGFATTNARYGFSFDHVYYESDIYELGKEHVMRGLESGLFVRDEVGAVRAPLPEAEFGLALGGREHRPKLLNEDGTSGYIAQDIGVAILKARDHRPDRSIYVVANEQDEHFKTLFHLLKSLGFAWYDRCHHLSYAMVELPDGKMKSREGTVVDADTLADDMAALAKTYIVERNPSIDPSELDRIAEIVAIGAIKFYLLRFNSTKTILFTKSASVLFDGDSGPFCMYSLVQGLDLLSDAGVIDIDVPCQTFSHLGNDDERSVALELLFFSSSVLNAAEGYTPSILVDRMLSLCKAFNRFCRNNTVVGTDADLSVQRLALVAAVVRTLRYGFSILGIETPDRL